jgi:hypothetical protein
MNCRKFLGMCVRCKHGSAGIVLYLSMSVKGGNEVYASIIKYIPTVQWLAKASYHSAQQPIIARKFCVLCLDVFVLLYLSSRYTNMLGTIGTSTDLSLQDGTLVACLCTVYHPYFVGPQHTPLGLSSLLSQ